MPEAPGPPPLAYRPLWLGIGWTLVLLVAWFSLTPRPPSVGVHIWDKASHAMAYFSLMFWFAQLHVRRLPVALWVLALGSALEIAQGCTGYREASARDMLANGVGVTVGWLAARRVPDLLRRIEALWP